MMQQEFNPIRVMLASSDQQLIDNLQIQLADAFPIQLVEVVSSGQACRSGLQDVAPDILLLVDDLKDASGLRLCREINLAHRSTAVILLSDMTAPDFYQDVFQAGGRGVVELTPSPSGKNVSSIEKLINAITRAYEYLSLGIDKGVAASSSGGELITIFSAKGGVGKTALAVTLAAAAAAVNPAKKVCYLDLNLQFGTSHTYLDLSEESSLAEIGPMSESLTRDGMLDMIVQKEVGNQASLYVIPSPDNPRDGEIVNEGHVRSLLSAAKRIFDLVVVDTTSTISDVTLPALQEADRRLLICLLDVMSVALLRSTLTLMEDPELNIPGDLSGIVINRVGKQKDQGLVKVNHIQELFDIPILGTILDDPDWVETRIASSEFLVTGDWDHPFQKSYHRLLEQLGITE